MERTVMVVDDDPVVHQVFAIIADSEEDVRLVPGASDGSEALERVAAVCPDAIICDVHMEPMGGLEALPELRRRCPRTVIVMYTADQAPEALQLGAREIFDKGRHDPGHVLDQLRRMLSSPTLPRPRCSPEVNDRTRQETGDWG